MFHITKQLLAAFAAPAFAVCATAQVTTSSIGGAVVDLSGEPIIGAAVHAVHVPTGTHYRTVTNSDGRFTIQGMRTGGPYTVSVSCIGYETRNYEKLVITLGEPLPLDVTLAEKASNLGEATVTAAARRQKGGGSVNYTNKNVKDAPTVDRSLFDVVRNSALTNVSKTGGLSFVGTNNRYNSFQIDGTVANDVFGLSAGGTNGGLTKANPVSLDAIEEIQVVVAPFDVRQSGFTGGAINAVTKQGTNVTHGSGYAYFNNENMYGRYSQTLRRTSPISSQTERTFGGTLGGAIVKDKLFYFASVEARKKSTPVTYYAGYSNDYISAETAQQIADRYAQLTGISESYGPHNQDSKSLAVLARLDWNISEAHHLALRYQHNGAYADANETSTWKYYFSNSSFRYVNRTNSVVAELNSHFSSTLYNELRAGVNIVRDHRETPYDGPSVNIQSVYAADGTSHSEAYIGTEYSSGRNSVDQDIYTFSDNLSFYHGSHTFTFGTHNEFYRMQNLFLQGAFGEWRYASLDDFLNDKPNRYRFAYTDPSVVGSTSYSPVLRAGQFGFYVQDKYVLSSALSFTLGLRMDLPTFFNRPMENVAFNSFAKERNFGVRVGEMPAARPLFSPRFGFNWYVAESRNTLLRGGAGVFTGRIPFAWLNNAFLNTGTDVKKYTITANVPSLTDYKDNPLAAAQSGTAGSSDIVTIAHNFKFPQTFRANLALEQRLPGDVHLTLEGIYSKTYHNVFFENLALEQSGSVYAVEGVEAAAAPYYTTVRGNYNSIINLRNTNKGHSYSLTAQLRKRFAFGLDASAAYTFGHSRSVNDGLFSVAYTNWQANYSRSFNSSSEVGYSRFDVPHRLVVQLSYTSPRYWNGFMSTTVGLVYNGFSGSRYSVTMYDVADYNGDGSYSTTLLYVPTDEELAKMNFVDTKMLSAEESRQRFGEWIANDAYASKHRGQYVERNSNRTAWEHEMNLHLEQTLHNVKGLGRVSFTVDIMNFANMLNRHWGASYAMTYAIQPLSVQSVTQGADGKRVAAFAYNSYTSPVKADVASRWHCQVGFRVAF